jgi:hypothetical protein
MAGTVVSLPKKLGVRAGQSLVLLGAPERFGSRAALGDDIKVARQLPAMPRSTRLASLDCVMIFVDCLADLEDRIGPVTERLHPDGQIWVVWRTRRAADVTEEVVRRIGMTAGMVDTRVCAIDGVWTGMRLIIRHANRDALAYRLGISPRRTRRVSWPQPVSGAGSTLRRARATKHKH